MDGDTGLRRTGPDLRLLGIYLNDHLAGATGGVELFRRAARAERGTPRGDQLERLVTEVAQDRTVLLRMMRALGVPVRRYKVWGGWLAERAGRLKLNGRVRERSPLSPLVELEAMVIGVRGKAAGWSVLRLVADHDARLDATEIDGLLARAGRQVETLEGLRLAAAAEIAGAASRRGAQ